MRRLSCSPTAGAVATRSGSPLHAGSASRVRAGALRPEGPRGEHEGNGATDDRDAGARPDRCPRRDRCARRRAGGHSMGGMTIMSLATHRPDVFRKRAKATVLVARRPPVGARLRTGAQVANASVASALVTWAMQSKNGHVFVRGAFGENPVRSHMDLTRDLFGGCHGAVRASSCSRCRRWISWRGWPRWRCRPPSWWAHATH